MRAIKCNKNCFCAVSTLCLLALTIDTNNFFVFILQIAWALNKGVKQEYKQFWDVDLGVTYIPWEKVKIDDLDDFAEGGIIDQETVNDGKVKHIYHTLLNNFDILF